MNAALHANSAGKWPLSGANDDPVRGWIVYDSDCSICVGIMRRVRRLFESRGFCWRPLQKPGTAALLRVDESAFATRMHVFTRSGRLFNNADALALLCRSVWWLWPIGALLALPGFRETGRFGYNWLARHRRRFCRCSEMVCRRTAPHVFAMDWVPAAIIAGAATVLTCQMPEWLRMWVLALALFAGCKWATLRGVLRASPTPPFPRMLAYLLAWPGMDPRPFFTAGRMVRPPAIRAWTAALANAIGGAVLVWGFVPMLLSSHPCAAGWLGMIGVVLMLHFGCFALLACFWQRAGINVMPLMRSPLAARSVSEFWGARWNTAFHELAHRFVFRPVLRGFGSGLALFFVFVASGAIHELVISVPARGGYGLPALYFLIQALGFFMERTTFGRKLALGSGLRGWLFTALVTAGPVCLLFPAPFIHNVIVPFLRVLAG